MSKNLLYKVLGVLFLTILMSWALSYVNTLILERQARQSQVIDQIAKSSAGRQTLLGPILVVPYTEEYQETINDNGVRKTVTRLDPHAVYIFPEELKMTGGFGNQFKSLGIYKALMYQISGSVHGSFKIPSNLTAHRKNQDSEITWKPAYVSFGITDTRGINGNPVLSWNSHDIAFEQGSKLQTIGNGMHANLGMLDTTTERTVPFDFKLNLRGMQSFDIIPIANLNQITLNSSWPHPHFNGSFLPDPATQKIDASGFSAKWEISSLSSNIQEKLMNLLSNDTGINQYSIENLESISVGFVEPINIYSQADRATKYGLLFIGLTFAGFFIFEILKRLPIHPAQYTLVGLAMALFYLLLVSLSEHIGFAWSYLIASLACVLLLGYYLTYVLKSLTHGLLFAGLLTALYGALYGILASEDNALLMGSLLVFGLLALSMIATRKVDWYQIGSAQQ